MNYTELKTAVEDTTENTFSATDFGNLVRLSEQRIYNSVQLPALRKNVTGTLTQGTPYLSAPTDFLSVFSLAVISGGEYSFLLNKDVNFIRESFPNPTTQGVPKYYALFGPDSANNNELTFILGPTPSAALTAELHYFYYPVSIVPVTNAANTLSLGLYGFGYVNGIYYSVPLGTSTGSGSGLVADVTIASNTISSVVVTNGGVGYTVGDQVFLPQSFIQTAGNGGSFTVATVRTINPAGTTWLGDNFDSVLFNAVMVEAARFMKQEQDIVAMYNEQYVQSLTLLKNLGDGKQRQDAYRSGQVRTKVI